MRSYSLLLAAAAAAVAAVPAAAAQAEETASITVSTADLDLASERGAEQLDRRIRAAAADVCGPLSSRTLLEIEAVATCRNRAISEVRGSVESALAAAKIDGEQMASRINVRRR